MFVPLKIKIQSLLVLFECSFSIPDQGDLVWASYPVIEQVPPRVFRSRAPLVRASKCPSHASALQSLAVLGDQAGCAHLVHVSTLGLVGSDCIHTGVGCLQTHTLLCPHSLDGGCFLLFSLLPAPSFLVVDCGRSFLGPNCRQSKYNTQTQSKQQWKSRGPVLCT